MNTGNRTYRPDIDGLRAVAVLLVLLYHAGFPVSGGYVGVDVFFVISGYLITGIVWQEVRERRFSFTAFYLRRFKRLLPALLVVVLATVLLVTPVFMPEDYLNLAKSLRYVLSGLGNFFFFQATESYFAADADLLPLIHTWSLAVEEQYYVLWPVILLAVSGLAARLHSRWVAVLALVAFVAALLASEYLARHSPAQAYYLLPARAFELMLGGLLAVYGKQLPRPSDVALSLLSLLGLAMIFTAALWLTRYSVFPGLNAFWVCSGSALVIYAGAGGKRVIGYRLLAAAPVVFVGLISYSLYLWHWPFVALANYLNLGLGGATGLVIVLGSMILAWLTWQFVEQPVRRSLRWSFTTVFIVFFLLPIVLSVGFHQLLRKTDGLPQRLVEPLHTVAAAYLNDEPGQLYPTCHDKSVTVDTSEACFIGAKDKSAGGAPPGFLLLGDSHANSAAGVFDQLGQAAGVYGLMATSGSSPFLLDTERYRIDASGYNEHREQFRHRIDNIRRWIQEQDYKGQVILAAAWHRYLQDGRINFQPRFEEALAGTLEWFTANGNEVVVYLAIQDLPDNPDVRCIALAAMDLESRWSALFDRGVLRRGDTCQDLKSSYPAHLFEQNRALARNTIETITAAMPGVRIIDPMAYLCDAAECRAALEGRYIYHDVTHINFSGGRALAREMLAAGSNVLQQPVN